MADKRRRVRSLKPKSFNLGLFQLETPLCNAQRYGLPPRKTWKFGTRRSGRQKIEKRSKVLEVLALKVPFRNLLVFPNPAPWPGRLRTTSSLSIVRCQTRTRVAKTASSEPHSLGSLFIADECQKEQAGNEKAARKFTNQVRGGVAATGGPHRSGCLTGPL